MESILSGNLLLYLLLFHIIVFLSWQLNFLSVCLSVSLSLSHSLTLSLYNGPFGWLLCRVYTVALNSRKTWGQGRFGHPPNCSRLHPILQ